MSDVVHEVSYRLWKHGVKGSTAWVPTGFFERGEHSNPPFLSICPYPFSSLSLLSTLVLPSHSLSTMPYSPQRKAAPLNQTV